MSAELLSQDGIAERLAGTPGWELCAGEIRRTFQVADFAAALAFVNAVGALAEAANHHPDIEIRWNKVTLALSTHSRGGLTTSDFELAEKINRLGPDAAHP